MKINLGRFSYRFKPLTLLIYLLFMLLLVNLGIWQLNRSEEKQQFIQEQNNRIKLDPIVSVELLQQDLSEIRYRKVALQGSYDDRHQILINNQIKNGTVGYLILTPFFSQSMDKALLVNRGWIPHDELDSFLKNQTLKSDQTIIARINAFPSVGLKLTGADVPQGDWPVQVQVVNTTILAEMLGYSLYPFQVELAPEAPDGYLSDWTIAVSVTPEKHKAYAVQWFALALTLTILMLIVSNKTDD
jgi:surfeit locus 1 family protein